MKMEDLGQGLKLHFGKKKKKKKQQTSFLVS